MAADDVEKREDSVRSVLFLKFLDRSVMWYDRDIEALLDHVCKYMPNEIDSKRVAVMGGSCKNSFI